MSDEHFHSYRRRVLSERDTLIRALGDFARARQEVLSHMLRTNVDTEFGRHHGFAAVRDWRDFRAAVPIRTYDELAPWIDRAARGESTVLSADDPVVYFMSSGSTGDSKKIPITREFMRTGFFPPFYAAWAPFVEHFPEVVARADSTLNLKYDPVSMTATTVSGRPHLGASQVDFGATFGEPLAGEPGTRAPWGTLPAPVDDTDYLEKAYMRLRLAAEHDVRCVIGINPAVVAAVPYQLRQWWPRLVKELHDGTIGGHPYGHPNRERAAELEQLAGYFGTLRPAHLWPNFQVLFCWTTGIASLYLPGLREEFGTGVRALPAPVAASEGFVGVCLDRNGAACSPAITAAFHEFADADKPLAADTETVLFEQLEEGHEYHVVLSHVGGLYRYALGDVVRVTDRRYGLPRVRYAGRATLSDVAGERLRESHVVEALGSTVDAVGLTVRNATCRPVLHAEVPRYEFAVACESTVQPSERHAMEDALDRALKQGSAGYERARRLGDLDPPVVRVLHGDAFHEQWQARVASGIRPPQVKDRVFQMDDTAWQNLLTHEIG
ncbi:GH3 auxin-responsive promoter family protein [Kibdelosporangium aridum]|uniref:GH3 auxin-responsive promoter family protein n=1 Tax=Kibdelosporangium aridum TaxID=2030 RepID=UPI00068EE19E